LHIGKIEKRDEFSLPSSGRTFKDIRFFNKYTKELFYSVPYSRIFSLFVQYKNDANLCSFKENSKTEIKDIPTPTSAESKAMPMSSELTGEDYFHDPSHRRCFVAYKISSKRYGKMPEQVVEQLGSEMYTFQTEADGVILVKRVGREEKRIVYTEGRVSSASGDYMGRCLR
jgi:hypothetical protein